MKQKGMTLVEILISLAILAFLSISVSEMVTNSLEMTEDVKVTDSDRLKVETFFSRFEYDFQHQYSPLFFSNPENKFLLIQSNQIEGIPKEQMEILQRIFERYQTSERFAMPSETMLPIPIFRSPNSDEFEFLTSGQRPRIKNRPISRYSWVRYFLGPTPNGSVEGGTGTSIYRSSSPLNPYDTRRPDPEQAQTFRVLDNVVSLDFQFWNGQRREFSRPLPMIPGGENFLRAVQLTLVYKEISGVETSYTRIFRPLFPFFIPESPEQILQLQKRLATSANTTATGGEANESGEGNTASPGEGQ